MNLLSGHLLMIGCMIIFGGIGIVFYLASIYGIILPGFVLLVPLGLGGSCIIYSLRLPDERQNLRADKQ